MNCSEKLVDVCPLCSSPARNIIYKAKKTPARHIRPAGSQQSAGDFGDLLISACNNCGHVYNAGYLQHQMKGLYEVHPSTNEPVHNSMQQDIQKICINIGAGGPSDLKILEIGCGVGALAKLLVKDAQLIHLIEPNIGAKNADFGDERLVLLPGFFPQASTGLKYDLVICRQVLEHIPDPLPFLISIREHLLEGGSAYVEVPSMDYIAKYASLVDFHYLHVHYYYDDVIRTMFARVGLEVVNTDTIKQGHDVGYHLVRCEPNPVASWPEAKNTGDIETRLTKRYSAGKARFDSLQGDVFLYGACAYAQAIIGAYPLSITGDCILDDTQSYAGYEAYSEISRLPVVIPDENIIARMDNIIISAWLHDAAIASRLSNLGFSGQLMTLRADEQSANGRPSMSLFADF